MTPSQLVRSFLILTPTILLTSSGATGVDMTLVEGATGTPVVMAVVNRIRDKCIFSDDRLFLRRMAYVASRDGTDNATYSTNQNGGIWKITQPQFLKTQGCTSTFLSSACQLILSELSIDWSSSVTWSDMRKPLYSGLAAALFTILQLRGTNMAGDITSQAEFWSSAFGGNTTEFSTMGALATDFECSDAMDLIFILDSSGSVSTYSFDLMRSFAADVVQVMHVDSGTVRVASVVFGSSVEVVFDLDDYSSESEVRLALNSTIRLSGMTYTHNALDQASITLYDVINGARDDAKKVAILITDGQSTVPASTANSAIALKEKGTTVFAIGVDNYNLTELRAVASVPTCSHVFTLTNFTSILSILTQIQISTCDASLVLTPGEQIRGEIPDPPKDVVTKTLNPGPNSTITVNATCGNLDIYVSYKDRNPSPVLYEEYYNATHSAPATLATRGSLPQGSPIYMTVVGTRVTAADALLLGCTLYEWKISVDEPTIKVRLVGGGKTTEGRVEVFSGGSWGSVCQDNFGHYDAIVVCRMLGYERLTPVVYRNAHYGEGSGTILLDEVSCRGAEPSIFMCPHEGVGITDCRHGEDVGVDCSPDNGESLTLVRLVGGSRPSEGRVEVSIGGTWGTVCENKFDVNDATVVCNMLNYTGHTPQVHQGAYYGAGSGEVALDGLACEGTETSIFLCDHHGLGPHDCTHSADVGIDCWPGYNGGSSSASTSPESDNSSVIGGVVGAIAALAMLIAGAILLKKHLARKGSVDAQDNKDNDTTDDTEPFPGLTADAPSMPMPADTRLPPLTNVSPRFPALRY